VERQGSDSSVQGDNPGAAVTDDQNTSARMGGSYAHTVIGMAMVNGHSEPMGRVRCSAHTNVRYEKVYALRSARIGTNINEEPN